MDRPLQTLSITTALLTSGGNLTLSLFDIPELQSQPASRSLPSLRWLFSRGSHIFPTNTLLACGGFLVLGYRSLPNAALPVGKGSGGVPDVLGNVLGKMLQLVKVTENGTTANGYLAAAVLCFSTAAFTSVMIPTNFELIQRNEEKGGARSQANASHPHYHSQPRAAGEKAAGENAAGKARSANESVNGKGQENQFTDLSGPQSRTAQDSSGEEDRKVKELLGRFGRLNLVRAGLLGLGGVVGLWTALG